jgi:hypothetical protein
MSIYAISISFDVRADSYEDAHEKRDQIMYLVKSEKLAKSASEIDVELVDDEEAEEGDE